MKGTPDRAVATGPGVVDGAWCRRVRGSGLRCRSDQVRGLSDRILRDLVLRSPVERRRTGDAVVLFYLAAKTDAKTGGRTIDDIWRAARPVTGDDATHAAIARGAFGVDDQATVQLVGACLRRLRNVPGGGRVPYPVPLVVAVDRFGVALPPSAGAGRGGYAGYAVRRAYRPVVARAEGGGRKRDPRTPRRYRLRMSADAGRGSGGPVGPYWRLWMGRDRRSRRFGSVPGDAVGLSGRARPFRSPSGGSSRSLGACGGCGTGLQSPFTVGLVGAS